jgi:hypothetical protein
MQGKFISGAFLIAALGSPSVAAEQQPQRQTCSKSEPAQQAQQSQQRQKWAQQQQPRSKPQGCPITRTIPSVVDPTPTFLL